MEHLLVTFMYGRDVVLPKFSRVAGHYFLLAPLVHLKEIAETLRAITVKKK